VTASNQAPRLSIVVVAFDMARELPRTIQSLLPPYQIGVAPGEVEIIVADNGSTDPVRRDWFAPDAPVTVIRVDDGGASPCVAINRAARTARAGAIAVAVDGARMASPGLVSTALEALRTRPDAFVATLGFHLGPKVQQISVSEGYTRAVEDRLLIDVGWPEDGYRLFDICALGESYADGVLRSPPETTFFVMDCARFLRQGGFNEDFRALGGGFANYEVFERMTADAPLIMLVGEGTFHQLHYGATTQEGGIRRKLPGEEEALAETFHRDFEAAVGRPYERTDRQPILYGRVTHSRVRSLFFPPERV
jgi:hypothetical protein